MSPAEPGGQSAPRPGQGPPDERNPADEQNPPDDGQVQPNTLATALGGRRGVADAGLPGIVFVAVYTATSLRPAVWSAVAVGVVLTAIRLWRRETLQHAITGFIGVALGAFIAQRTGRAENFFLPGLFINAGYGAAYLVSILVRWPVIGLVIGPLIGEGTAWRRDPARLRAYSRASWLWVAMFCLRLTVQLPLYLMNDVVALGVARLAMGWPLVLATGWLSYLVLRGVPPAKRQDDPADRYDSDSSSPS